MKFSVCVSLFINWGVSRVERSKSKQKLNERKVKKFSCWLMSECKEEMTKRINWKFSTPKKFSLKIYPPVFFLWKRLTLKQTNKQQQQELKEVSIKWNWNYPAWKFLLWLKIQRKSKFLKKLKNYHERFMNLDIAMDIMSKVNWISSPPFSWINGCRYEEVIHRNFLFMLF